MAQKARFSHLQKCAGLLSSESKIVCSSAAVVRPVRTAFVAACSP